MNSFYKLLEEMCASLLSAQITGGEDAGAFRCEACGTVHGRADNAVFPMAYMFAATGDEKYTDCIRKLLVFQKELTDENGAVCNDRGNNWRGITVFSAIRFYQTLVRFGSVLPGDIKNTLETRLAAMGAWVFENVRPGFRANINYYCAAAYVNAACGEYFGNGDYTENARELLAYCMGLFTENGLLAGEGQPHDSRTAKDCVPFDAGYCAEESYPCLAGAAKILGDIETLQRLAKYALSFSALILPDGGLDNSFGSRNNKWTYYGGRTSDGLAAGFLILSAYAPELREKAVLNTRLLERCFEDGQLYGGINCKQYGQPACVHLLFSHAAGLADALCEGLDDDLPDPIPKNDSYSYQYLPETDTYMINAGPWRATVTGYDFRTYTFERGAAHSSGGSLSLLYHRDAGITVAGSVFEYKRTEPNNMPEPAGDIVHASLIPRAEYEKDGCVYATCLDPSAELTAENDGNAVAVCAKSRFVRVEGLAAEDEELTAFLQYCFNAEKTKITVSLSKEKDGVRFVLPLIEGAAEIRSEQPFTVRGIFCLAGGFRADEYTFIPEHGKCVIDIFPRKK